MTAWVRIPMLILRLILSALPAWIPEDSPTLGWCAREPVSPRPTSSPAPSAPPSPCCGVSPASEHVAHRYVSPTPLPGPSYAAPTLSPMLIPRRQDVESP